MVSQHQDSIDPVILGRIVHMQNTMHAQPDTARLSEFLEDGFRDIPGVGGFQFCLEGEIAGGYGPCFTPPAGCFDHHRTDPEMRVPCPYEQLGDGRVCLRMSSLNTTLGGLLLQVDDPIAFALYDPFLRNVACLAGLLLENQHQSAILRERNENLERVVAARTAQLEHELTRRREAEEALSRSEAFHHSLVEMLPLCLFRKDSKGRFLYGNQAFLKTVGLPFEELLGKTDDDLCPQSLAKKYREDDEHLAKKGGELRGITEYVTPSGEPFQAEFVKVAVYDEDGGLAGIQGAFWDISERLELEGSIRASQRMLQLVLDTIPVTVFWKDRNGVYMGCNRQFAKDAGMLPREAPGKTDADMPWRLDAQAYRKGDLEVLRLEQPTPPHEECQHRANGQIAHLLTIKAPLRDDTGAVIGVLGTYEDITARKTMELEQKRLELQIQHAQKLESLGVLAGGIAHDFNNLLMTILGNAELATQESSHVSPIIPYLNDIEQASRRAADLCQQMLAYSGKGRFHVEPISLNAIIQEMSRILEVSISKKSILNTRPATEQPMMEADKTQLRQVIMNLVCNANEAIVDKSGVITLTTGILDCDQSYLSCSYLDENLPPGRYVYVEVTDNGCGMTPEVESRLFDPFFTTKFTGRGLGMAAVLGIVRGHHGAIKIQTAPGQGSSIRVMFPALLDTSASGPTTPPAKAVEAKGVILIVDDEERVRILTKRMLERMGMDVYCATHGREALEVFRKHGGAFDCVLLDLTMPHMDGEETFHELRKLREDVRVIIASGYNEHEVTQRFIGKGLAGFIQKPYQLASLKEKIAAALGRE